MKFSQGYNRFWGHSLVTIPPSYLSEEYVLLIGGNSYGYLKNVFKFNGTWFSFGQLNRPRAWHNCIYWNGAVYVIGGIHRYSSSERTKMEIWKIKDSPDQFETLENWPELNDWNWPHLFIVKDSFFPDY